jgi:serine phosphatase RsbU (regulator of sigma subunit)
MSLQPTPATPPAETRTRGRALVVDDESTTRLILRSLLQKEGFTALTASNGQSAIELFEQESPSIVLVDVIMPGMNGFEVAGHIKKMAGGRFVPIIFLTAITDENTLAECIRAGGDDFLTKPVSLILLRAKITAAERMTHLYETIQRQHHQLLFEQQLARQVYAKTLKDNNVQPGEVFILQRPASVFSGDLILVEKNPSGTLHVLLGDFTGHGLAAAIGALPAADIFRSMTSRGYSPPEILAEINRKLRGFLPTGMFLAVVFIRLHQDGKALTLCNCGLPEVLIQDGQTGSIRQKIPSQSLPLGISARQNAFKMNLVEVSEGDQVVIATDGFTEAKNAAGEFLGSERFQNLLENGPPQGVFERLVTGLEAFIGDTSLDDDVTLAVIPCRGRLPVQTDVSTQPPPVALASSEKLMDAAGSEVWEWETRLGSSLIKKTDLAPVLLRNLTDFLGAHEQRHALFTVISELLNNAVDHGLLGLDSHIKDSPEGFVQYFEERTRRLADLNTGHIRIRFRGQVEAGHGWLLMRIEDSGTGFDHAHWEPPKTGSNLYGMRGLQVVRGLCKHLQFEGCGNIVQAIYTW